MIGIFVTAVYNVYLSVDDVKAFGLSLYAWLNKQNPMIAGAISLWALGSGTYIARDIPSRIWRVVVKQTTVVLTLNNIDNVYDNFLRWYHITGRSAMARTLIAKNSSYEYRDENEGEVEVDISAGYGTHYFMFGGKPFQFSRDLQDANNTKDVKESITLTTIGRSQAQFHKLIAEVTPEKINKDLTLIYKWAGQDSYWQCYAQQPTRKFDSVILPQETKDEIVNHIETFLASRQWYMDHGIPYRTGLIFHGIPGTGKTSLVRALCEFFKKPLYIISLTGMSDIGLEAALSDLPRNALVLIEDIDTYSITKERSDGSKDNNSTDAGEEFRALTLSGLLNAIDGIIASDGRILIATTNHIEKLDSALTRKGRFNISIEIGYLTHECFIGFFHNFYPEFGVPEGVKFKEDMTPANLQALIMDHIDNPEYVLKQCINAD